MVPERVEVLAEVFLVLNAIIFEFVAQSRGLEGLEDLRLFEELVVFHLEGGLIGTLSNK